MKPAAATVLTLSVMFVDFVIRFIPYFRSIKEYFIGYHMDCWERTFYDVAPWWSITESILYLMARNITFWLVGTMVFCSRDLKS